MNILIRNLSRKVTEPELRKYFASYGVISSLNIVTDEKTGASKGFGFVEMKNVKEAKKAIQNLNGKKIDGEAIRVKSTKQKKP